MISIILLFWIGIKNFDNINIVKIKNNAYFNSEITKIENLQNVDDLKAIGKEKMHIISKNHQKKSEQSKENLYIILAVIGIQIFLLFSNKKSAG